MIKINKKIYSFFLLLCLFQINIAFSDSSPINYSFGSGMYYSKGAFSQTSTNGNSGGDNQADKKITLSALPLVFGINRGLLSAKISTNYLAFTNQTNGEKDYQGFGNLYLSGKRLFPLSNVARFGDVQIKFKLPSADTNSELGSKGLDTYVTSSLYFKLMKNWIVTSLTYKHRGNNLNNTFSSSTSYSHAINKKLNTGVTLKYEQALEKAREEIIESMLYVQWKQSREIKLTLYYIQGHKDPVLQQAGGLQTSYYW